VNKIKRTGKFYRNNESEVMRKYGLKPTANSGAGWIEKEDGENDRYICQLKSTEKDSIKINLLDLHKLIYHADIAHKIPVFMVQFITQNEEYVVMRAEDVQSLCTAREGTQEYNYTTPEQNAVESVSDALQSVSENSVKSAPKAREKYYKEREQVWKRKSK
jgi:anion-transporting  ArsA/GET3 family ATPase